MRKYPTYTMDMVVAKCLPGNLPAREHAAGMAKEYCPRSMRSLVSLMQLSAHDNTTYDLTAKCPQPMASGTVVPSTCQTPASNSSSTARRLAQVAPSHDA